MLVPLDHFLKWETTTPDHPFLRQPVEGKWHVYSYRDAGIEIRKIASAIRTWSLPAESRIAILSKNCAHWIMTDLAIWMAPVCVKSGGAKHRFLFKNSRDIIELDRACHRRAEDLAANAG